MFGVRLRVHCWMLVCAVTLRIAPVQASQPRVDFAAMEEAINVTQGQHVYPVASSYAHFLKARLSHYNGAYDKAVGELYLAQATGGDNPFLQTALAEEYVCLSQLKKAERLLIHIVRNYPHYASAQLLLGRVLYAAGSLSRAKVHLVRAIELDAKNFEAHALLAQLSLGVGHAWSSRELQCLQKSLKCTFE